MSFLVIIPSRMGSNLRVCMEAIARWEPDAAVIVVDDGIDFSQCLISSPFHLVQGQKPFVFGRNCNIGIAAASAADVILLNDDATLISPRGFSLMQQAAEEHPEYGVIGAATNVAGQPLQKRQGTELREVPRMVCFVCAYIPRRTLDAVGLLDEDFTGYGYEDDAYCLRVRQAGLKIGVHDGCYVDHANLPSTYRTGHFPSSEFTKNREIFISKYGSHPL